MALTTTQLAADLALIFADQVTQTITWRGGSYTCIATDLNETNELMPEGMNISAGVQFIVTAADFTGEQPKANDVIVYDSVRYRVADNGITTSCDGLTLTINCDREIN